MGVFKSGDTCWYDELDWSGVGAGERGEGATVNFGLQITMIFMKLDGVNYIIWSVKKESAGSIISCIPPKVRFAYIV